MKKAVALILALILAVGLVACTNGGDKKDKVEGELTALMNKMYETGTFDKDLKESFKNFDTVEITDEMVEGFFGTKDIKYTNAVVSMPKMSSIAYECILIRLENEADAETVKQTLKDNAQPNKWLCVEAEKVVVESRGDLVLFAMCDQLAADALVAAFKAL